MLFLLGVDVLRDAPAALARRALQNAPFTVIVDTTLREDLAPYADVVLPASAPIEREGTFSDWEGRAQPFVPVRPPFAMSRPDWQILQGLSEALGSDMALRSIGDVRAELASLVPTGRSIGSAPAADEPAAPASPAVAADDGDGLLLFSYPLLVDEGRQLDGTDLLKEALSEPAGGEVHPDDAARLGLHAGDGYAFRRRAKRRPGRVTDGVGGACFVPWNNPGLAANALFPGPRVTAVTVAAVKAAEASVG